jgi:hypothetical protein
VATPEFLPSPSRHGERWELTLPPKSRLPHPLQPAGDVVYFLGMAHQFLPERPLARGDEVSERLIVPIEGYGVGSLPRSNHDMGAGVRFAAEQKRTSVMVLLDLLGRRWRYASSGNYCMPLSLLPSAHSRLQPTPSGSPQHPTQGTAWCQTRRPWRQ